MNLSDCQVRSRFLHRRGLREETLLKLFTGSIIASYLPVNHFSLLNSW